MTAKSDWDLLPEKAYGGVRQTEIETKRWEEHCKTLKMDQARPTGDGRFLWIPDNESDFCNHLIKGPNAPSGCPKSGAYNLWKCCRCGEVTRAGMCSSGCRWVEWGWICIFHKHGDPLTEEEYLRRIKLCDLICEKIKQQAADGTLPIAHPSTSNCMLL